MVSSKRLKIGCCREFCVQRAVAWYCFALSSKAADPWPSLSSVGGTGGITKKTFAAAAAAALHIVIV